MKETIPTTMETKLRFFDCNCAVGRLGTPPVLDIPDAAGLKAEMAAAGIEEALVFHTAARDGHPPFGNALLMDEIMGEPNIHPVWVVLPHHTGEMPRPEKLLESLKANGVKAVRMFPGRTLHSFSLAEWCIGELLAAIEEARLPLMLDVETTSWDDIAAILTNHPRLPVIATDCGYRHNRYLYPLLEKHTSLFIDMARFVVTRGIEDLVGRFGSRPLLFGTNMPFCTGTGIVSFLAYSDIARADKEAIAGGNLRRLLEGIRL